MVTTQVPLPPYVGEGWDGGLKADPLIPPPSPGGINGRSRAARGEGIRWVSMNLSSYDICKLYVVTIVDAMINLYDNT